MRTVTGANRGEKAIVTPILAGCGGRAGQSEPRPADGQMYTITGKADTCLVAPTLIHTGNGERKGQAPRCEDIGKPLGTVVAGGQKHAVVSAFLYKHYGGVTGQEMGKPLGTVTAQDHHSLGAVHLTKLYGTATGASPDKPMPTASAQGQHVGPVVAHLTHYYGDKGRENPRASSPEDPLRTQGTENRFGLVYAFLSKYFGTAIGQSVEDPLHTVTGKARFGVVTVTIEGEEYAIADIGMRMLQPHELARAQGFPENYVLTGTKTEQVAKIGNSVCPPVAEALVRSNLVAAVQTMEKIA